MPLRVRSMVGLIPLFAVEVLDAASCRSSCPASPQRLRWFLEHRPDLAKLVSRWNEPGGDERRLLSLLRGHRMKRLLRADARRDASSCRDYGIRSLSKYHERRRPSCWNGRHARLERRLWPGESRSELFGGNSNWRGPVWMPVNYLLIEALQRVPPLLRRRFQGRMPDRLRTADDARPRSPTRLSRRLVAPVPARTRRAAAGLRRHAELHAGRPAFPRPSAVLRIFPRRYRARPRRLAPDRLDRRWSRC